MDDAAPPGSVPAPGDDRPVVALVGGTGKLGSALASRLVEAGRTVVIGSRDAARAAGCASALGERLGGPAAARLIGADNAAAARMSGIVVITVPFDAQEATVRGLAADIGSRVVISTAVPVTFVPDAGPSHVEVPEGSAAEQVAALLPRARVVGALHTVSSVTLAKLDRDVGADIIVTGGDAEAKSAAAALLAELPGVRVVDGGPLRNSRYAEQLAVLLLSINTRVRRSTGIRVTNLPDDRVMVVGPSRDHAS